MRFYTIKNNRQDTGEWPSYVPTVVFIELTVGQKEANAEKASLQKKSISEGIYGRIRPRDNAVNRGIPEIMVGLDVYRK